MLKLSLSVYPTNSKPDHPAACRYQARSTQFHLTPQISVPIEHLI